MHLHPRTLLTIICEAALENTLLADLERLGARGYTITEARGKGEHGRRDAAWSPNANVRIEVMCDRATAEAACAELQARYYADYSMVMFLADIDVLRPAKFGAGER